jgi:hypothetical protein
LRVRSILSREVSSSGVAAVSGKNVVEEREIGEVVGGRCVQGGDVWKTDGVGPEERDEAQVGGELTAEDMRLRRSTPAVREGRRPW